MKKISDVNLEPFGCHKEKVKELLVNLGLIEDDKVILQIGDVWERTTTNGNMHYAVITDIENKTIRFHALYWNKLPYTDNETSESNFIERTSKLIYRKGKVTVSKGETYSRY